MVAEPGPAIGDEVHGPHSSTWRGEEAIVATRRPTLCDWDYDVRDGASHHEGGEALVFGVAPTKVMAFETGDFAQTRYRF
jgi:hypothetical protein